MSQNTQPIQAPTASSEVPSLEHLLAELAAQKENTRIAVNAWAMTREALRAVLCAQAIAVEPPGREHYEMFQLTELRVRPDSGAPPSSKLPHAATVYLARAQFKLPVELEIAMVLRSIELANKGR